MTWAIVNISDNLTTDPTRCDLTYNLQNITVMPLIYVDVYFQVAYPLPFQLSLFHSFGTDIVHANSNAIHRPLLFFFFYFFFFSRLCLDTVNKRNAITFVICREKKEEIFAWVINVCLCVWISLWDISKNSTINMIFVFKVKQYFIFLPTTHVFE